MCHSFIFYYDFEFYFLIDYIEISVNVKTFEVLLHTTTLIDADTKDVYAYVMMMHDEHLIMTVMRDIKTKNI